jgi:pyruvate/2-oxoglutarate dehydrogenase complex dihydrolipoamide dehydrogenase (E3) component
MPGSASYDVVILGAGSAAEWIWGDVPGLSVAVVESGRVGGECPFVACVPSKAMLRAARVRRLAAQAHLLGASAGPLDLGDPAAAFASAVARRDEVSEHRSDAGNADDLAESGAVLWRGRGRIVGPGRVLVTSAGGTENVLAYRDLVLATGSAPQRPAIPGLDGVPVWTSDQALASGELPPSVLIMGGGAVGCELAQVYATFGVDVCLIESGPKLLGREDTWLSDSLAAVLAGDGIDVRTGTEVTAVEPGPAGAVVHLTAGEPVGTARILLAAGRRPNLEGIGLEVLGLDPEAGLDVEATGRVTGADHLWAAGDITGVAPFTHTANYQSRIVAANLRGDQRAADYRAIPRVVYTDPPVAAVGITEAGAGPGARVRVETVDLSGTARAATDGTGPGGMHLIADLEAGLLVGAAAIGPAADELIGELTLAIRARVPLAVLADVVHAFPTHSEALEPPLRRLAG